MAEDIAEELQTLRHRVRWLKDHAEMLEKNWESHHNACMGAIRHALGLPDATVPEMVARIRRLRARPVTARLPD